MLSQTTKRWQATRHQKWLFSDQSRDQYLFWTKTIHKTSTFLFLTGSVDSLANPLSTELVQLHISVHRTRFLLFFDIRYELRIEGTVTRSKVKEPAIMKHANVACLFLAFKMVAGQTPGWFRVHFTHLAMPYTRKYTFILR